jgi:glycosyltransferase involved in cell wall biosynthesis
VFAFIVTMRADVLLAVWNRFFSEEQAAGFLNDSLTVSWVGTGRSPQGVKSRHRAWLATAFLRLYFTTGYEFLLDTSRIAFERKSRHFSSSARFVWAYMEFNNGLLEKCRIAGIPTVLDVPIGHQRPAQEVMAAEFARYGMTYNNRCLEKWTRTYERAYDLADHLVVGSSFVRQSLVDHGVAADKIIINPYGVDTTFWGKVFRERVRGNEGTMTFVYTASVNFRKGIQYLLRAWRKANLKNCELLICGSNCLPAHAEFTDFPKSVHFLGWKSHDELSEIYKKVDVYVLPSLFEGLARSGLEAMASGLPPIVTWETGLADMVEDGVNGWVIRSRDEDSLADCLRACAANPRAVKSAGIRAQRTASKYSWENYGSRCAAIVRQLSNNSAPR